MINWPLSIVDAIARRRAVLLIGSGVSANSQNDKGARPPTWGAFLRSAHGSLSKKVPHIQKALSRYDYLSACEFLRREFGHEWPAVLRGAFVTPGFKAADIHRAIFDLDSRIVISLNFDQIYEKYAMKTSENTVFVKNYYDDDIRQVLAGSDRYILKPHGSIDTPSKMIFTLESYSKARTENINFYEMVTALLHTHTFILLGCGLSDPDVQAIFEDYRYKYKENPHFMTMPTPIAEAEKELIMKTRGINVMTYSKKNDHRELTDSLFQLVSLVNEKRNEIADLRSW